MKKEFKGSPGYLNYLKGIKKIYSYRYLYKLAYNKLFIIDNIEELPEEEWK